MTRAFGSRYLEIQAPLLWWLTRPLTLVSLKFRRSFLADQTIFPLFHLAIEQRAYLLGSYILEIKVIYFSSSKVMKHRWRSLHIHVSFMLPYGPLIHRATVVSSLQQIVGLQPRRWVCSLVTRSLLLRLIFRPTIGVVFWPIYCTSHESNGDLHAQG